jgi:hypothetical protein
VSGLLFLEEEFVVLEIQVVNFGLIKKQPEKVKAEYALVDSIRFEPGLFSDRIIIVPKKVEVLDAVPGSYKGEIVLKIEKRYRDDARRVVTETERRRDAQAEARAYRETR